MKKSLQLLAGLCLLPLSTIAAADQVVQIGVTGMVCEFCVSSVEKKLNLLPGVKRVHVSLEDKRAEIVLADGQQLDPEQLRSLIVDAGFTPGELSTH